MSIPAIGNGPESAGLQPMDLDQLAARLRSDPEALAEFVERLSPGQERKDGWAPFTRRLFLQVIADTGRLSLALAYTGMSKSSAYALRDRDALFAAGWDAAALMARNPMADEYAEKALDGVSDMIVKDGVVVAERRRFDSRLSIAVLNRLDKRCDRAEERGSYHIAVMRHWDEWLDLIGKGDEAGARALIQKAQAETAALGSLGPFGPLPESGNPTEIDDRPAWDGFESVWKTDDGMWMTVFPPPPGFDGLEKGTWDGLAYYERACTSEEAELIEAHHAAMLAEEDAELTAFAEAQRDTWFARLRRELAECKYTVPREEPGANASATERDDEPADQLTETEGDPLLAPLPAQQREREEPRSGGG